GPVDGRGGRLDDVGVVTVPPLVGPGGVPVAGQQALPGRGPPRGPVVVEDDHAEVRVLPPGNLDHHGRFVGRGREPEVDVDTGRVLDVGHHLPADGVDLRVDLEHLVAREGDHAHRRLLDVLALAGPVPGHGHTAGPLLHRGAGGVELDPEVAGQTR